MLDLEEKYKKEVIPEMKKRFGYKNNLAVPRIKKVIVNTGIGSIKDEEQKKLVENQLSLIVGQKVAPTKAKKSISTFKIRKGAHIGYKATLRGKRMYDFLNKMIYVAIPRKRDFRGLNYKSIDPSGNLTIGFKEHIVFPEMSGEDVKFNFGLEATIVTNAKSREESLALFELLGFPFAKKQN